METEMKRQINGVVLFTNGQVAVFDENGFQMSGYQGHYDEVVSKITANYKGSWSISCFRCWIVDGISLENVMITVDQWRECWR
jgi:hypothetical protein